MAKINFKEKILKDVEIIPCIYITNRTLKEVDTKHLKNLAQNIYKLILSLSKEIRIRPLKEVQFDCDWSSITRENYFFLLEEFKRLAKPIKLSATIRLHQTKYFERTGVPPTDSGTLMFYNMGDLSNVNLTNTILDLDIAKKYTKNISQYPLPLNLALPAYSWVVLIRLGKTTKVIHHTDLDDLKKFPQIIKIGFNRYQVKKSFYFMGELLYKNDILRFESAELKTLKEASRILCKDGLNIFQEVIFFHISSLVEKYRYEDLEDITQSLY